MKEPPVVVRIKSAKTVRRALSQGTHKAPQEQSDYVPKAAKPSPLHVARIWLGSRLEDRPGKGYFVDGVPAHLDDVMRATNRVLKSRGIEQVTACERWIV